MSGETRELYAAAEKAYASRNFQEAQGQYLKLQALVEDPQGRDFLRRRLVTLELLGKPAPDWGATLRFITGSPFTLDASPKPFFLYFFQWTCPDCRAAFPWVKAVFKKYEPFGLKGLGVDSPLELLDQHTAGNVETHAREMDFPFPVALDKPEAPLLQRYRAVETPYVALVGVGGTVEYLDYPWPEKLELCLQQLLNEKAAPNT